MIIGTNPPRRRLARSLGGVAIAVWLAGGCFNDITTPGFDVFAEFQFAVLDPEWQAGFADVLVDQEDEVGFIGERRNLPGELGNPRPAMYLRGDNISDDLFMYWKRRLTGLTPSTTYDVTVGVEYASNFPQGCTVGNAVSVWIKAGLSEEEPQRILMPDGYYRMNIDKGEQSASGPTIINLGDIRNSQGGCDPNALYGINSRRSEIRHFRITSSPVGAVWVIMGTESGFEAPHDIYFMRLRYEFTEALPPTVP